VSDQHMMDRTGYVRVPCYAADAIRGGSLLKVGSSLTDMCGEFGEALVYTEWGIEIGEGHEYRAVMREYRWPKSDRACEHWVVAEDSAPTLPPSSRQRGRNPAKAVHDRRPSSADETDLRDDGGIGG